MSTATPGDVGTQAMSQVSRRLLPILMAAYFISILDRSNVSVAALTMNETLGLTAAQYGLGAGLFFVTYVALEAPSNALLARVGARRWIAGIMIAWGLVASAMTLTKGPGSFYTFRLLLGAAEAGFFPGVLFYLARWYPAEHRGKAYSLILLTAPIASAIGTPLGGLFLQMHGLGGLDGWQWLFVLEGLPAVLLGVVVLRSLTDRPQDADWLSQDHRTWLLTTLEREKSLVERQREAGAGTLLGTIFSPVVVLLALSLFFLQANTTGLVLWMPLIMESTFGGGPLITTLLASVPYVVAAIAGFLGGRFVDRYGRPHVQVVVPCAVTALTMSLSVLVSNGVASFILLSLGGGVIAWAFPAFWKVGSALTTGTASAVAIAVINSVGALAGFAVPFVIGAVRQGTAGFALPMYLIAGGMIVAAALFMLAGARNQRAVRALHGGVTLPPSDGSLTPIDH